MRLFVVFLVLLLISLNLSDSDQGVRTTASKPRIERIEVRDLPEHVQAAMQTEKSAGRAEGGAASAKPKATLTRVDPDNRPLSLVGPGEKGPSWLLATFSDDDHSFSSTTKWGGLNIAAAKGDFAFGGTLGVTKKETRAVGLMVFSSDQADQRIFSENGQYVVDDGFFLCRLSAKVDVLYGASAGVTFLGVGGGKAYDEGLSYVTTSQQCVGRIDLPRDEHDRPLGVRVSEIEEFCRRCTGDVDGRAMDELMQQSNQRAHNATKFTIKDTACNDDDACYTNDIRYTNRCVLKSESRKINGADKTYYYRRCEGRVNKNGWCTPLRPNGTLDWIGPRDCDAGLTCTLVNKEYDWWHFRYDYDYKCLTSK